MFFSFRFSVLLFVFLLITACYGVCDENAADQQKRAQGCLMGQFAGDSLGALAEFMSEEEIAAKFPQGPPRLLTDKTVWGIMAGQPTDDSEMALMLARMLLDKKSYDQQAARERYIYWMNTPPFDIGNTTKAGLLGKPRFYSSSNGSLMRISPLGIFCTNMPLEQTKIWAMQDSSITHPNRICLDCTALLAMAISTEIRLGLTKEQLYKEMLAWSESMHPSVKEALELAAKEPPKGYMENMGSAVVSLHNAVWQMLHAENFEEAIVDTVRRGGDTDTNAAIAGALLGCVYGIDAIPGQWQDAVVNCRPAKSEKRTKHPRPEVFWPSDVMQLSLKLLETGKSASSRAIFSRST